MARYTEASCRLCRREGAKLFLKGIRCFGAKCAFSKRNSIPGQHGKTRVKLSDYGLQLREKQKLKRIYGLVERQFHGYFKKAIKLPGVTGDILLQLLERRLDNVLFRARFADSRAQARQMVAHGYVMVDDHTVNIPAYLVKPEQMIKLKGSDEYRKKVKERVEQASHIPIPEWLSVNENELQMVAKRLPERKDISYPIREQLIVELYSK